jgi:hypothetical protein
MKDETPPKKRLTIFQKIRRHTSSGPQLKLDQEPPLPEKIYLETANETLSQSPLSIKDGRPSIDSKRKSVSTMPSQSAELLKPIPSTDEIDSDCASALPETRGDRSPLIKNPGTIMRFQQRFPDVSDDLMEIHSCAWERDILWQGRIYITASTICFYAKIFGNEVKKAIPFRDIIEIEKANMAAVFPNAIRIHTNEMKYFFASFLRRDLVYDHLKLLWANRHTSNLVHLSEAHCSDTSIDQSFEK